MQLFEIFQYIFLGIAFSGLVGFGIAWYVFLWKPDKPTIMKGIVNLSRIGIKPRVEPGT